MSLFYFMVMSSSEEHRKSHFDNELHFMAGTCLPLRCWIAEFDSQLILIFFKYVSIKQSMHITKKMTEECLLP